MKGIAEESPVFASEIFTAIYPVDSHKRNTWNALIRIGYIGFLNAIKKVKQIWL